MQGNDNKDTEAEAAKEEQVAEVTIEFDSKEDRDMGFDSLLMESNTQFSSMGDSFTVTAGQCAMLDGKGIKYPGVAATAATTTIDSA